MVSFASIISEKHNLKKPKKNEKNIFTIYSPQKAIIEKADTLLIDTEISIKLPENSTAFLATKFEGQEILKIIGLTHAKKRLWITLLNESYLSKYQIDKVDVIGYLIIEPNNIKVHYEEANQPLSQKKRCPDNYFLKDWEKSGKTTSKKRKTSLRQTGGFLNRSDFEYAGREFVNQAGKMAPKLINQATGEINKLLNKELIGSYIQVGQKLKELHQKS